MAGQQWFGQLEGRIQRTVEELAASKKLIWYIPDMLQLARSGTHQGQAASILDQILPAVSAGRLIVWTEATPTGTARLVQPRPTLRGLLEVVRLEPQSQEETSALAHAFVQRLANEADLAIEPRVRAGRAQLGAPVPERRQLPGLGARSDQAHRQPRPQGRRQRGRGARRHRHAVAAHRPAGLDPRQQRARRPRLDPRLLRGPRHRPGRGGRGHRRPHRHAQGGPQRSRQADRRVPVRRPHRHRQDRARQDGRRISVRLGRPHDPPRHERVPDRRDDAQDPRRRGRQLADQPRAQAAVLGGAARRVREGARHHLGPVPAGVRRRPADRRHGPRRRLPPLHHHPHHQPRRHQPPHLGPRLRARRRTPSPATRSCARSARPSGPSSRTGSTR